jgi:CDP-glycerol:poly(glycerophosphate) glycerophosphotransferase
MISPRILNWARSADTRWQRWRQPDRRNVLINAALPMEYAMIAAVERYLAGDKRIHFYLTSTRSPERVREIFRESQGSATLISPDQAKWMKIDAYLAADFIWAPLPRGTRRIQMFHGVAGKYGNIYDQPEHPLREWDRFFFINRKRMEHFFSAGAIDRDGPQARLVGMPKVDCLVDGTLQRNKILESLHIDPARRTVLYAPTWTPYSSLNAMGEELVERLTQTGHAVIVKLHDNSRDPDPRNSGGINWVQKLAPMLQRSGGCLAPAGNIAPMMVAADVMIGDHSSAGFEYLLLDRPLIRIEMPELLKRTSIAPEYTKLMIEASTTVHNAAEAVSALEHSLASPGTLSAARKAVAEELFYLPGTATQRAVRELYDVLELAPPTEQEPAQMG